MSTISSRAAFQNQNLMTCVACGITSLDGDPSMNIPYPNVAERDECGGEILCDECFLAEIQETVAELIEKIRSLHAKKAKSQQRRAKLEEESLVVQGRMDSLQNKLKAVRQSIEAECEDIRDFDEQLQSSLYRLKTRFGADERFKNEPSETITKAFSDEILPQLPDDDSEVGSK